MREIFFVFNTFNYCKPVNKIKNKSNVSRFKIIDDSTSRRVLDLLETIYLKLWDIVVGYIDSYSSLVKFGICDGGCNDMAVLESSKDGCSEVDDLDIAVIWSENVGCCSSNMKPSEKSYVFQQVAV